MGQIAKEMRGGTKTERQWGRYGNEEGGEMQARRKDGVREKSFLEKRRKEESCPYRVSVAPCCNHE